MLSLSTILKTVASFYAVVAILFVLGKYSEKEENKHKKENKGTLIKK